MIARGSPTRKLGERMKSTPHFVLFSRTREQSSEHDLHGGSWYFRLESTSGDRFEASDVESHVTRERLELLAVVRGLEALEQPSSVTLVTSSKQISRAIRQGLEYWRVRHWKWERFGEKVPMNNGDLWQRIDGALQIHNVRCRTYRLDGPHSHHAPAGSKAGKVVKRRQRRTALPFRPMVAATRWTANSMHKFADGIQRLLPDNSANPHLTM